MNTFPEKICDHSFRFGANIFFLREEKRRTARNFVSVSERKGALFSVGEKIKGKTPSRKRREFFSS